MKQLTHENQKSRSRPKLFRALGDSDPPVEIEIEGVTYLRDEIVKHDSWAATAIYGSGSGKVACKFNRLQPILGFPMNWFGAWLAKRERTMYQRLSHIANIPHGYESVTSRGKTLTNAAAHEYITGSPLRWHHRLSKQFFEELQSMLHDLHRQGIAVVDLNKKENIIVGDDQKPYLIDFQISIQLPRVWPFSFILKILQQADRYHLDKHLYWLRPDMLLGFAEAKYEIKRPFWIRLHRKVAVPFRQLRRRILVAIQVRKGDGKVHSEQFVEAGLRRTTHHSDLLLSLFQLLVSQEYYQSAGSSNESYIERLFVDLWDRKSDQHDTGLVDVFLDGRSREEIVIQMLRSPALFAVSHELSDHWLRERVESIQMSLLTEAVNSIQVSTAA